MLLDIKNTPKDEINDRLYDAVHNYAAVDFEVQKFKGDHAKPGSMLEKYCVALAKLKRLLDDSECIVIPLPSMLHEINYKLRYKNRSYKLDSESIIGIHKKLDGIIDQLIMKY